ncbi:Cysteine dioxygenase [Lachnellula hyalina]|uniref:Cysteine dioxygenase n=1 Tax=Lachnellula hyalina TaxID=1316788 RepID=A0A8H8U4X5_9HELO|nr:Cysteine dioxygenase [Lachnellula hyalina]TVY30658.1 Cysteine dioxygenase [Lachnellula hyalina]
MSHFLTASYAHYLLDFHSPSIATPLPRVLPTTRPREQNENDFDGLIANLTQTLTTTLSPTPTLPVLHQLMKSYTSNPAHWSKFAHIDPSKQYTRNLVHSVPGVFNLLLLVWNPGKESPAHDHANAHCLMKILKGNLIESRFAIPSRPGEQGPLVQTARKEFGLDQVTYMADVLGLHAISNPHPTEHAMSLHLYTPPNAALRGCHVYDMHNGEVRHVRQDTYDSVGGRVGK